MVSLKDICVSFGSFDLLTNISFLINEQDRIGLAGRNGAGKTTLLRVIAGEISPTSGIVDMSKQVTVGYLPQQMKVDNRTTVMKEVLTAFSELLKLSDEIEHCSKEIASRSDFNSPEYLMLCEHLIEAEEKFRIKGGDKFIAETEKTLSGLGFDRKDFDKPTSELSGGWRMRIELAKIILKKPSLLLLDEPTNHLDIEAIQWFESFLSGYPGAVVLVSHDRAFLDNVTTRTIEISRGKIYDYRVPWSQFTELRKERREQQMAAWLNQKKMIEDTERFIERFRYKATKAVQVQSRIKQLEKIELIEIDEEDTSSINVRFPSAPRSGTVVVEAENVSKSFDTVPVLNNVSLTITRGEKVAFIGRNGEGKTTLSRIIVGELDYSGVMKTGYNVKTGYFAQNQDELMDEDRTVLQTIDEVAKGEIRTKIRDLLAAFLFRGEEIDKKVKVLSGGERSRLALVKLLLEPYNLLVLDEPTNHLDMRSKEILKQALIKYDGTLIVVSHDRDFLDGLVTKIFEFRNHRVKEHQGGIYDYLRKRKIENLREIERKERPVKPKQENETTLAKQRYLEKKEYERNLRKLRKRLELCEADIMKMEEEIREIDEKLMSNTASVEEQNNMFRRYEEIKSMLNNEMNKWAEYYHEVEEYLKMEGNADGSA